MRISNVRRVGRNAYHHLSEGLRTVGAIIEKSAHVYALTQPLLQQSFDTRPLDASLLAGYASYQRARQLASQIDGVIN
jgi:hypothetical protein